MTTFLRPKKILKYLQIPGRWLLVGFGVFILNLISPGSAHAATYTLITEGAANAQTPGNWNTGGTGGGGTAATNFTTGGDVFIIANGTAGNFAGNATFGSGVTLQIDGTASITGVFTLTINGIVVFSSANATQISSINSGSNTAVFYLSSGATLTTANTNGVQGTNCSLPANSSSGNNRFTASLSSLANFGFNGTANQSTLGMPATINSLTVNNTGTTPTNLVNLLSLTTTISQSLNVISGVLNLANITTLNVESIT